MTSDILTKALTPRTFLRLWRKLLGIYTKFNIATICNLIMYNEGVILLLPYNKITVAF